ncbi:MAG: heme-binding protein [Burkholderiales bacterium]|nr:heme-binding protein [Burkholderiales bacterium]
MKTKTVLTLTDALRMTQAARAEADRNGWAVVIAIVDDGAHLLCLERMDGCKLGSIETARRKAESSVLFARPTKSLEDIVSTRSAMLKLPNATPIQGGLPIEHNGMLVGGIGVSGVQSGQDEQIAAAGCAALLARD